MLTQLFVFKTVFLFVHVFFQNLSVMSEKESSRSSWNCRENFTVWQYLHGSINISGTTASMRNGLTMPRQLHVQKATVSISTLLSNLFAEFNLAFLAIVGLTCLNFKLLLLFSTLLLLLVVVAHQQAICPLDLGIIIVSHLPYQTSTSPLQHPRLLPW